MSGNSEDRKQYQREYNRRYYEQKLKQKRQQQRIGDNQGQLDLFDLKKEKFDSNIDLTQEFDSQKSSLTQSKRRISLNRFDLDSNLENQTSNILTLTSNTEVNNQTFQTMNQAIDEVAQNIHQLALNRLFPSAKRRINFWVIGELLALIILSIVIVTVTTKAVATVDASLWPLVALLEVVAMFFSLTLANHAGANFVARGIMLIVCVGLTNFLVAKATLSAGEVAIGEAKNRVAQAELLRAEIRREQLGIVELEARGRITLAGERTKRLDQLREELGSLQKVTASVDKMLVWLTVIIRVVLGFSVILINHQISHLIVNKKFLKFAI